MFISIPDRIYHVTISCYDKKLEAYREDFFNEIPPQGKWYYVSDSHVMETTEEKVLNAQAYLLNNIYYEYTI